MKLRDLRVLAYPVVGVGVILLGWELYVDLLGVSSIVLPSPLQIWASTLANWPLLMRQTWPTFLESLYGFLLALAVGIPMAVAVTSSRVLNLSLYPIFVATQSVPKVAVAPIILVWFGIGVQSKLAIAFLVAFFPIVVDTATGLASTPPGLLELAASLSASRWQVFLKVQLPAALPHVFAGAKVAVTLAVVGAVIGEFVGANAGLGNLLLSANSQLDGPLAWAALLWLSVLGIGLFLLVAATEWIVMPWARIGHR
jgi:NitT/TauT family transport system permease protein